MLLTPPLVAFSVETGRIQLRFLPTTATMVLNTHPAPLRTAGRLQLCARDKAGQKPLAAPPLPSTSSCQHRHVASSPKSSTALLKASLKARALRVNSCLLCIVYKCSVLLLFPCTCFDTEKRSARKGMYTSSLSYL